MAKPYKHVEQVARQIEAGRLKRALTFKTLGSLAGVDTSQTFRICNGEFRTLNPSVLKICNVLKVLPPADGMTLQPYGSSQMESSLSAEVLSAWDQTEAGGKRLIRVLRALRPTARQT